MSLLLIIDNVFLRVNPLNGKEVQISHNCGASWFRRWYGKYEIIALNFYGDRIIAITKEGYTLISDNMGASFIRR